MYCFPLPRHASALLTSVSLPHSPAAAADATPAASDTSQEQEQAAAQGGRKMVYFYYLDSVAYFSEGTPRRFGNEWEEADLVPGAGHRVQLRHELKQAAMRSFMAGYMKWAGCGGARALGSGPTESGGGPTESEGPTHSRRTRLGPRSSALPPSMHAACMPVRLPALSYLAPSASPGHAPPLRGFRFEAPKNT